MATAPGASCEAVCKTSTATIAPAGNVWASKIVELAASTKKSPVVIDGAGVWGEPRAVDVDLDPFGVLLVEGKGVVVEVWRRQRERTDWLALAR